MKLNILYSLLAGALAHPGESHEIDHDAQLARRSYLEYVKREGGNCNALARRSENIAESHRAKIAQLRQQVRDKKLKKRGEDGIYATIDHESSRNITADIALTDLFSSDDSTCLLQPEVTQGPFYVAGEYVRNNITEGLDGVPLYLSAEFFDVNTCEVLPNLYWELWHCNPMGVYSGVQDSTNGNGVNYYNETWLRGVAPTDENGQITMETIFPGHYDGRATHIHAMVYKNVTVYDNGTIGSGGWDETNVLHVGQIFFDQDLLSTVYAADPYTSNTATIMDNSDDAICSSEQLSTAPDPFPKYVFLGDDVTDGIYAWIAIGVDSTAGYTRDPAAYYDYNGGHAASSSSSSSSSGSTGGDSGMGGNSSDSGSAPSGGAPSGSGSASGSYGISEVVSESATDTTVAASSNGQALEKPGIMTMCAIALCYIASIYM